MSGVRFLTILVAICTLGFTGVRLGFLILPQRVEGVIDLEQITNPDGLTADDGLSNGTSTAEDSGGTGADSSESAEAGGSSEPSEQSDIWESWQAEPNEPGEG